MTSYNTVALKCALCIIYQGHKAEMNITFKVDKSLCLPKLNSITALLYDFSTLNEKFLLSLLKLEVMLYIIVKNKFPFTHKCC